MTKSKTPTIQRLLSATQAFLDSWNGKIENAIPAVEPVKLQPYAKAVKELADMMMDPNLNHAMQSAAMEVMNLQNQQIDDYFKKVMQRSLSPGIFELYSHDRSKIPGSSMNTEIITDFSKGVSGRHITIWLAGNKIGDAKFMTRFQNGKTELFVEEIIK